jgi:hypothetical protein
VKRVGGLLLVVGVLGAPLAALAGNGQPSIFEPSRFETGLDGWSYDVADKAQADPAGVTLDATISFRGSKSARVRFRTAMGYAGIIKKASIDKYAGSTLVLRGTLRKTAPTSVAGLWLATSDKNGKRLEYINSYDAQPFAPGDWHKIAITVKLPCNAAGLIYGAAVYEDDGDLWIDEVKLERRRGASRCPNDAT